ncbi:MAG: tRNA (adenosine(37)-N6)-threonylcarbamoyltransferase complex ATPase subunit type 1 TsaE [Actinomycetia bacterium]|nr:tRNA (adenosine(37)-N6)-threonylcarbamoyltransferase complex ATPase subunit type 1 TsaE [Actinomycetes bacterium]
MKDGHLVLSARGVRLGRLERIGRSFARLLRPGDLVFLYGPLGAGKTTFVRAVAGALEVSDPVRSPSFTIANIYAGRIAVQHLDLYRLDEIGDDDALALEEYVDRDALTLVEWPEAGLGRLGSPTWIVRIGHESEHKRSLEIEAATAEALARWTEARPSA